MPVCELNGVQPTLGDEVFVVETAVVIGDVHLGEQASVWFGAVVRGDCFPIRVGARTNIQDNAVVHVTGGRSRTTIGDDVTIGHAAVVHGCTIGRMCLLGIGCIVLDDAVVGEESLIAAGALVTPGTVIPPRSLVMGRPGRVVRAVGGEDLERIRVGAAAYVQYAREYRAGYLRIG
ncbi:MAG: gamma carbonic anhydrase family protein [Myxococcales bacterium]|nr:gamma carbonic anhydrase family protein [Myxococcales bacterium]